MAWKVAYADFVTAMMAFFLLLWLYSVTTPIQKTELSDYFTPTNGLKDELGVGFKGGDRASLDAGKTRSRLSAVGLVAGQQRQGDVPVPATMAIPAVSDPDSDKDVDENAEKTGDLPYPSNVDRYQFQATMEDLRQAMDDDPQLAHYKSDVVIQDAPAGLNIDLIDAPEDPLFEADGTTLTKRGKTMLISMTVIIERTPNALTITGHTSTQKEMKKGYDSWELSLRRANEVRRFLLTTQMDSYRILKVVGQADRDPLMPQEPANVRNNRITITLMRGYHLHDVPPAAPPPKKSPLSPAFYWPSLFD